MPATAKGDGEGVVVRGKDVAAPRGVRYAWEGYPEGCNLYNKAGLPATPFRVGE